MAFVTDAQTEFALREGLEDAVPEKFEFRRAGVRAATALLAAMPTPLTIIVDLSGEENPLAALADLSQVVEPDVRVLVVGDQDDVNFYRQVTRGLGALEYLHKPLIRDLVARQFGPLLNRQVLPRDAVQGGRLVTVTGVRGGVGAQHHRREPGMVLGRGVPAPYRPARYRPAPRGVRHAARRQIRFRPADRAGNSVAHRRAVRGACVPARCGPVARPCGRGASWPTSPPMPPAARPG